MSKTIKVDESVYYDLEKLRGKRETFSSVVARLLRVIERVQDMAPLIYAEQIGGQRFSGEIETKETTHP